MFTDPITAQKEAEQAEARVLAVTQAELIAYIRSNHPETLITKAFREAGIAHWDTRHEFKNGLPIIQEMDLICLECVPAYSIDYRGLPGHSKRFDVAKMEFRVVVIRLHTIRVSVNFCRTETGTIHPVYRFTYEDGRFHEIRLSESLTDPSVEELNLWLKDLLRKNYVSEKK